MVNLGKDDFAEMAKRLYREEGIDTAFLRQAADVPTGVGFILVDEAGHNCIALDPGANDLLSPAEVTENRLAFDKSAVVLTQLETPVATAETALTLGRAEGATTILNPAPVRALPGSILRVVDVLTPNQTEANVLTGRSPDAGSDPGQVARELIGAGVRQVVMTMGEKGALIVTESSSKYIPAPEMRAVDTTGAGDAFNAGLATALANGENLEAAVRFAVITGALAVTREGVIPSLPRRQEVAAFLCAHSQPVPTWLMVAVVPARA